MNKLIPALLLVNVLHIADASPIHSACLKMSEQFAGRQIGEFVSNSEQLVGLSEAARLHSITTCHNGELIYGVQFSIDVSKATD